MSKSQSCSYPQTYTKKGHYINRYFSRLISMLAASPKGFFSNVKRFLSEYVIREQKQRYEEGGFGVTGSLFNCLLNLLVQELTTQRMCGLGCHELMAISSTLSKAGNDLEGEQLAWSVVMRETARCMLDLVVTTQDFLLLSSSRYPKKVRNIFVVHWWSGALLFVYFVCHRG